MATTMWTVTIATQYLFSLVIVEAFMFGTGVEGLSWFVPGITTTDNPLGWGVISPSEDQYKKVGETLSVNCTITGYNTPLNATYMYFTHRRPEGEQAMRVDEAYTTIVGPKTLALSIPDAQEYHGGWYYCKLNESTIGKSDSRVITQTSPIVTAPPRAITKLTCISDNYESMTCDWCDQAEDLVNYQLQWNIGNVKNGSCQVYKTTCQCIFCRSSHEGPCADKDQDFFRSVTYNMTIVASKFNTIYTRSEDININTRFAEIVKPRPPASLSVNATSSSTVSLTWESPPGLDYSRIYPLDYRINYTSSRTGITKSLMEDGMSVYIDNLQPYTKYTVTIEATPNISHIYYSNDISDTFTTKQTVPSAGPVCIVGGFRTLSDDQNLNKRTIIFFWGHIGEDFINGELNKYIIYYSPVTDDLSEVYIQSTDAAYDSHEIELTLDSDQAYNISIAGYTIGEGVYGSILIPPHSQIYQPVYIDGEVHGSTLRITVIPPDNISVDSYTLLYCKGALLHGRHDITHCKESPVVLTFPGENNLITVEDYNPEYVYGLSMNYAEGTSGLTPQWLCLYDYDGDPGFPAVTVPLLQNERSLTIEWPQLECSDTVRGRVMYYMLNICAEGQLVNGSNISVTYADGPVYNYAFNDLVPFTKYTVNTTACTSVKCGSISTITYKTLQSVPSKPLNILAIPNTNFSSKLANSTYGDLLLTWQPPQHSNGIITHYRLLIKVSGEVRSVRDISTPTNSTVRVEGGLPGYTNYTVSVYAVNDAGYSLSAEAVSFSIPITAPGDVSITDHQVWDNSVIQLSWLPPNPPNGPSPQYELTTSVDGEIEHVTVQDTFYELKYQCSSTPMNVSIHAFNILSGRKLIGPRSEVTSVNLPCSLNDQKTDIIIGGTIGSVFFVCLVVYLIVRLMQRTTGKSVDKLVIMPRDRDAEIGEENPSHDAYHYLDDSQGSGHRTSSGPEETGELSETERDSGAGSSYTTSQSDHLTDQIYTDSDPIEHCDEEANTPAQPASPPIQPIMLIDAQNEPLPAVDEGHVSDDSSIQDSPRAVSRSAMSTGYVPEGKKSTQPVQFDQVAPDQIKDARATMCAEPNKLDYNPPQMGLFPDENQNDPDMGSGETQENIQDYPKVTTQVHSQLYDAKSGVVETRECRDPMMIDLQDMSLAPVSDDTTEAETDIDSCMRPTIDLVTDTCESQTSSAVSSIHSPYPTSSHSDYQSGQKYNINNTETDVYLHRGISDKGYQSDLNYAHSLSDSEDCMEHDDKHYISNNIHPDPPIMMCISNEVNC